MTVLSGKWYQHVVRWITKAGGGVGGYYSLEIVWAAVDLAIRAVMEMFMLTFLRCYCLHVLRSDDSLTRLDNERFPTSRPPYAN